MSTTKPFYWFAFLWWSVSRFSLSFSTLAINTSNIWLNNIPLSSSGSPAKPNLCKPHRNPTLSSSNKTTCKNQSPTTSKKRSPTCKKPTNNPLPISLNLTLHQLSKPNNHNSPETSKNSLSFMLHTPISWMKNWPFLSLC